MEEKKETSDAEPALQATANVTISRGYKLPLAKLRVSGSIGDAADVLKASKVAQRAIIFVIDRSGSMSGSRINMVKEALKPFVEEICRDENTIIKLVLFDHNTEVVDIPRDPSSARSVIEKRVHAQGGTDFHQASQGLVQTSAQILQQFPSYQLTVIMCSDGEVGKQNAERGHKHWKEFVAEYSKAHKIPPYVETIGISSSHDADVLDGFICDDSAGNYCKCGDSQSIGEAFKNAQNETMGRTATRLHLKFPLNVQNEIYHAHVHPKQQQPKSAAPQSSAAHDLIVTNNEFAADFWIDVSALDRARASTQGGASTADGDELPPQTEPDLFLLINEERVPIQVREIRGTQECQYEAIDYYNQVLKDMLHTLRNITDAEQLKLKAQQIESELNTDYIATFESLTAEPVEKQKMQKEIKRLLSVDADAGADADDTSQVATFMVQRRAELMKQYKKLNAVWKRHRTVVTAFQHSLSCVKTLIREIILGQVRMQEIRQHILDLHFRKKHAKRINKLVLSDEALAKRREMLDTIEAPDEKVCADISDEVGTGCYLSTLSKREVVLDADALWICGRVNRTGGAAVSNPELLQIDYVSSDLVSDSYFRMAMEAASASDRKNDGDANDGSDEWIAKASFADSSRQLINARFFPIYGNLAHYKCSKPFVGEALSHTLSGRRDIRCVNFDSLNALIGFMVSRSDLTHKNVRRVLYEVVPSYRLFCQHSFAKPYKMDGDGATTLSREPDKDLPSIRLSQKYRCRLQKYTQTFRARTTAWVSTAQTLFADALMNLDVDLDSRFFMSLVLQRLRHLFTSQIPKALDEDELRNKVTANHKKILQVLVCGTEWRPPSKHGDDEKSELESNSNARPLEFAVHARRNPMKAKYYELFSLPKASMTPIQLDNDEGAVQRQFDANVISPSMKQMLIALFSRLEFRDLIQGNMFFQTLASLPCDLDADTHAFDEFRKHAFSKFDDIPNDLNVLLNEVGFAYNVNVLRAMCCVAIIAHSNRAWLDNLSWFGDDRLAQVFTAPEQVLQYVYQQYVVKNIRHEYDVYLENKRIHELIALHSDPVLPDDIDEYGCLPELRCGWKRCGKVFDNRDKLLDHVRRCLPHVFVHRFHLHCRMVLEANPNMSLQHFSDKALKLFDEEKRKHINSKELAAYYQQFQPMFKKGINMTARSKPEPAITSTSNMYYFDQLVSVKKS